MLRLREPQYQYMPPLFPPGWDWLGDEPSRPTAAFVCFDDRKEFLFVAFRPDSSGTTIYIIPLELGDEQSTVGVWKQLDPSLSSRGLLPRAQVTLAPPPISENIVEGMLAIAEFPNTPHNIEVLSSMLTRQLAMKAYQFISNSNEAAGRRFAEAHSYRPGAGISVARQIVKDLADWNPQWLPYMQDMPMRVRAIMLEALGAEGTFWDDLRR